MIVYFNSVKDPFFNLAVEEVIATSKEHNDQILILWQNKDTVVIGRNQNVFEEVNVDRVKKDGVNLVRRKSGGGAVFQDLGNFCYTFIVSRNKNRSYKTMISPIVKTLNRLGIKAYFSGKNDIKVDGKKISGNCQYLTTNNVVHHGTILFDVNLNRFKDYLTPNKIKLVTKGIKSNQALVTNIKPFFKTNMTLNLLWKEIIKDFKNSEVEFKKFNLEEIKKANLLMKNKYCTNQWIYGLQHQFNYRNKKYFTDCGTVEVLINVKNGLILDIKFYGDFLGSEGTDLLEKIMINSEYQKSKIKLHLDRVNVQDIFGVNFTNLEILELICNSKFIDN